MSALSLLYSSDVNPRDFSLSGYVLSLKLGNNLVARRSTFSIAIMYFLYRGDQTGRLSPGIETEQDSQEDMGAHDYQRTI